VKLEVPLGQSLAAAGCRGCGSVFTGVTGFDRHQRWIDGVLTCLDPAALGMERKPDGKWGKPGTEGLGAKLARFTVPVNFSGPNPAVPVSLVGSI
jgi:hypothetical protein